MHGHDEKGSLLNTTPRILLIPHYNIPKVAMNPSLHGPLQHQPPYFRDEDESTSHELEATKLLVGENVHELGVLLVGARAHELGAALGGHRSRTGGHRVVVGAANVGLHLQTCWDRDYGPVVRPSLHPGAWARWRPA
jgi:hypothetical protein